MKHSVNDYAHAFAAVAAGKHSPAEQAKLVQNFVSLVRRNGDAALLPKVLGEAGRLVREKEGIRKLTIETARPLAGKMRESVRHMAHAKDVVEEKVVPELVAGMRVTIDDERQFDASLSHKLQKMFA